MGKLLNAAAIFAANDLKTEDVDVPEWGGTVRVKALTGLERDTFESGLMDQRGKKMRLDMRNARARLVAIACINEAGERVFADDQVTMLGTKSAAALDRVYDVASRLAGISEEDMEELTGNSEATTPAGLRSV